ncbi:MAG: glycosyltransferase family 39 protein [Planctomycetota bacterium]
MDDQPDVRTNHESARGLRWVLAVALGVLCLAGWLLGTGTGAGEPGQAFFLLISLAIRILGPLLISLAILTAAGSAGAALVHLIAPASVGYGSRLVFSLGLGLGIISTTVLAVGSLGLMSAGFFWALMTAFVLCGLLIHTQIWTELPSRLGEFLGANPAWRTTLVGMGALFVLLVILSSGAPVFDYDTLEYHLGAPGQYHEQGRISHLDENVYAAFPMHTEMLYLAGIGMSGSRDTGMRAAILTQGFLGLMAALAIGLLARHLAGEEAGLLGALFYLSCPVFILSTLRVHITHGRVLYLALSLLAVREMISAAEDLPRGGDVPQSHTIRMAVLAGLSAGLAVAVKYPAALMVCVPLGVFMLGWGLLTGTTLRQKIIPVLCMAGAVIVAIGPWLLKNYTYTGNPVYPLLYGIFDGRGWSSAQAAKFAQAHEPRLFNAPGTALRRIWRFLTGYADGSTPGFAAPLALVFVPFLLVRKRSLKRETSGWPLAWLAVFGLIYCVFWATFTHRIERFLVPVLVPMLVLSAAGCAELVRDSRWIRRMARLSVLVLCLCMFFIQALHVEQAGGTDGTLGGSGRVEVAEKDGMDLGLPFARAVEWINDDDNVSADASVMLVGEARIYPFERRLEYSVVFNRHPLEDVLDVADRDMGRAVEILRNAGPDYVLINWPELRRLSHTYRYSYAGRDHPGYLPQVSWRTRRPLRDLMESAGRKVKSFGQIGWPSPRSDARKPVVEIYRIE